MAKWKQDMAAQLEQMLKDVAAKDNVPLPSGYEAGADEDDEDVRRKDPQMLKLLEEMVAKLNNLTGLDFGLGREEIMDMLMSRMNGNWDVSCSFDDGLPGLRLIQEDEFDQHREEDDDLTADYDFTLSGDYIWVERNGWESRPSTINSLG